MPQAFMEVLYNTLLHLQVNATAEQWNAWARCRWEDVTQLSRLLSVGAAHRPLLQQPREMMARVHVRFAWRRYRLYTSTAPCTPCLVIVISAGDGVAALHAAPPPMTARCRSRAALPYRFVPISFVYLSSIKFTDTQRCETQYRYLHIRLHCTNVRWQAQSSMRKTKNNKLQMKRSKGQ